jgi:dTMP kinase
MAIVAICGIDGSGKTSTCAALAAMPALDGARLVAKRDRRDVALLRALHPAEDHEAGLLAGSYATAVRWAQALDFLRFYDQEVLPLLDAEPRGPLLISDRWTVCSVAYADVGTGLGPRIAAALAPCRPADLVVYLDVPPEVAVRRIAGRGDGQADESLAILQSYHDAYERWLPRLPSEVVRVAGDGRSPPEVAALVLDAVTARFAGSRR